MNQTFVQWLSNKQHTIDTFVFVAKFLAMEIGMVTLQGLRYKTRIIGIPLSGTSLINRNNMSVIHNIQRSESAFQKKIYSICYHGIWESVSMGESLTAWVPTGKNTAIFLLKFCMGQSVGILWGMYSVISTMSISN